MFSRKKRTTDLHDIEGREISQDSKPIGALVFDGKSAVTDLAPLLREHLNLPAKGPVTLTAEQFDHVVYDAAGSGWHNAVRQVNRFLRAVSGGALQIGEDRHDPSILDDGEIPTADDIGEPVGRA